MKYKKGFTLIELLAVITIIGLLITIMVPNVQKFSANTKEKMLAAKYETLQDAALIYAEDIKTELKDDNDCYKTVTVKQLIDNEYIKSDGMDSSNQPIIINPVNKASLNDVGFCLYIKNNNVEALMYNNCPEYFTYSCPITNYYRTDLKETLSNTISLEVCHNKSFSEKTQTATNQRWNCWTHNKVNGVFVYDKSLSNTANKWDQQRYTFYDQNKKVIRRCVTKPTTGCSCNQNVCTFSNLVL